MGKRNYKKIIRICKTCGQEFETNKFTAKKYCSKNCYPINQKTKWKGIELACPVCNEKFIQKSHNQKFCTRTCCDRFYSFEYQAQLVNYETKGIMKLRFEIFKRDFFTCQYCGRNVKDDGIKLHCDHIQPRSKGGRDVPENLVTACLDCNIGKGDALLEEREFTEPFANISE
jgi:5-methylcytosine-specific restriction endonuclease McrA